MTASRFYFCALPKSIWESNELAENFNIAALASEAMDSERRIRKEVNLASEYRHYTSTCQRIERTVLASGLLRSVTNHQQFAATIQAGKIATQVALGGYLALLSYAEDEERDSRLGASFYPPNEVHNHHHKFATWVSGKNLTHLVAARQRLEFLEQAESHGCGVVEIQSPFLPIEPSEAQNHWDSYRLAKLANREISKIELPDIEVFDEAATLFREEGKQIAVQQFRNQVRSALQSGEPVTIGNQARHDVITEVLHELVFAGAAGNNPTALRIAYVDGSEAETFPVFCLPKEIEITGLETLSAALMSVRHYELDEIIDFCWFRNREVSQSRTLAESDTFCYRTSLAQLQLLLSDSDLQLDLYHTGFEPAVIGFYRALVQTMINGTGRQISVRPLYFRAEFGFESGRIWSK